MVMNYMIKKCFKYNGKDINEVSLNSFVITIHKLIFPYTSAFRKDDAPNGVIFQLSKQDRIGLALLSSIIVLKT